MSDPATLLDPFVRGIAAGAVVMLATGTWRSAVNRQAKIVSLLTSLSIATWLITESGPLWGAFDRTYLLLLPAYPIAGMFWLFIGTVFEDRPIGVIHLLPPILMGISGVIMGPGPPPYDPLWIARNVAAGLLALHAGFVVAKGWRGDLLEARRGLRAVLLGLLVVFAVLQTLIAFAYRLYPSGPWLGFTVGELYGGTILAILILFVAASFLRVSPELFGAARTPIAAPDARSEAIDRHLLQKIDDLMAAELWRQERLTIGELAHQIGETEHRVRRLINQRLGHRNFADFLNAYRIAAAKQRLADPGEARATISAVAFDLGYGSLGPFNRAFRAATGSTPTEWRRVVLAASTSSSKSG